MKDKLFGFIGLGNMGQPMAQHIVRKGYRLLVHDIAETREKAPENTLVAASNAEHWDEYLARGRDEGGAPIHNGGTARRV